MGNGVLVLDGRFRCFSDIEGNSTNKYINALSFLVGKHSEPQSIKANSLYPLYQSALSRTLSRFCGTPLICRNSCIKSILGDSGATSRDDAIFSAERYFRRESLLQELKSPWEVFLTKRVPEVVKIRPADWPISGSRPGFLNSLICKWWCLPGFDV